ncbi:MAG: hypothetical protein HY842_15910 [Bacteroidetes bacterium]|nr:hypothetical protein [Bacteroidota bacterium]
MERIHLIGFFVLSFLVKIVEAYLTSSKINFAVVLGSSIALFLIPYVVVMVIKGFNKLFKADFSNSAFLWTYIIAWILFAITGFIGSKHDSKEITKSDTSIYRYSPKSSLYEISFSKKPTIKEASVQANNTLYNGEIAEISNLEDNSFQRVEFYVVDSMTVKNLDKESLIKIANQYSVQNGLNNPEYTYIESDLGKNLELRAYKTLTDKDKVDRILTYVASTYVLGDNMVTLFAGCESKDFPTSDIQRFLSSIKRSK